MPKSKLIAFLSGATALAAAQTAFAEAPLSATVLEFADPTTLFVADSAGAKIHAYTLPEAAPATASAAYTFEGFSRVLAETLGIAETEIAFNDLAVNPATQAAFVSLTAAGTPALVMVTPDGTITPLDLSAIPSTSTELATGPDDGVTFWRDIPSASLTVTDLDYTDGTLFVSGLSTGEFASTLNQIPYPFGEAAQSTSVEIYHAVHDQMETRAPIRAMEIVDLDGVQTVIAAYTCTPLVTLPTASLTDGAHITGNTIAELGYGNTPLEVLLFDVYDREGNASPFVMVVNRELQANLIPLEAVAAAANAPGLTEPVSMGMEAGVETIQTPMSGVYQAADQDPQFLLALKRNLDTGAMDLVSIRKGVYLRLSDFISEYDFPDYVYADNQMGQGIKGFHNLLKAEEGFPELIEQ
ncbi:hypothetical protein [Cognatiyoonia sp. IB215182]|uniref:hypothetical protein n=1 Tax=Cognatiyoonia sp. IB215182 TaxID=3097353 RepID=UPI002A1260B5|nr:hypothetical protein [Cognatiyoonia sp. IB215182]MDX8355227.1 hypothetical protein [Cognatiyoonia sp. IB215182]